MTLQPKLMNQGGFGCVFYPAIECNGTINKSTKYASKLLKKDSRIEHEYNIGKMVKKIDLYEYYYAPVISMCDVDLAKIDKREKDMCRIIKKNRYGENADFAIMKIPFIKHIDISTFLTRPGVDKKEVLTYILDSYTFLLNNLRILNINGIIHYDLKAPNILIEEKTKTPIIIDFGLSIPISDIRPDNYETFFYSYSPSYYIWPIDVHIICYLVNMNPVLTSARLEELIIEYIRSNSVLRIFSEKFIGKFKDTAMRAYSKYIGMPKDITINELVKNCNTWDNYALSVMFLNMIGFMSGDGFTNNKLIIEFSKLLLMNFHPDGKKRLSFEETKKYYDQIFSVNETLGGYKRLLFNFNDKKFHDKTIKETKQQEKLTPVAMKVKNKK
jgi:serine/threonine protein kinase|uniref:Protein kinase domain-containing protein n=1 Tax=viral metagenome TaxID=1070528 RepID=A0A6C0EXC8_9ZZZZ